MFVMPDPSLLIGAVQSAVPTNKDLFNVGSQLGMNYLSQQFSKKMYGRQYDDAIKFWNMQNEYNNPANQMQRFREAGLNPNLIYGRGDSGNAGPLPSPPSASTPEFKAPRMDSGQFDFMANALGQADLKIKGAQYDNLKAQNADIVQQGILRGIMAKRAGFDLDFETSMLTTSADMRREQLRKLRTETDLMINRDAREAAQNATSIQEAGERMLTMQSERTMIPYRKGQMAADTERLNESVRQMLKDGTLKDLDIELRKLGINPGSPLWSTVVGRLLSNPDSVVNKAASGLSSLWSKFFSGQ